MCCACDWMMGWREMLRAAVYKRLAHALSVILSLPHAMSCTLEYKCYFIDLIVHVIAPLHCGSIEAALDVHNNCRESDK